MKNKLNTRTKKPDLTPLLYGKLPPQAPSFEGAVLGAIMIEPQSLMIVETIITLPEVFYTDANQRIYASIRRLSDAGKMIDFMTVCEDLRKNSELEMVGGSYYVTSLTRDVVSSAHIEEHARVIVQKYVMREIIKLGGDAISEAYEDSSDVFELLDKIEQGFITLGYTTISGSYRSMSFMLNKVLDKLYKPDEHSTLIKSGMPTWDKANGGSFQSGTLGVGAGRTGTGKTTFLIATTLLQSITDNIAVWNGELTEARLLNRYLANISGLQLRYFRSDKNNPISDEIKDRIQDATTQFLSNHKLHIDNTPNIVINDLIAKIRYWVKVKGVKMVWLDYLRYIQCPDEPKFHYMQPRQQVDYIMQQLLKCAKDCNIPIILLTQVNREPAKLSDKKPKLEHLRESGAIEEIASFVFFLHSPSAYGEKEDEQNRSTENYIYFLIEKNSDGENKIQFRLEADMQYFRMKEEHTEPLMTQDQLNDLPF